MIIGILKCETAPKIIVNKMGDYDNQLVNFLRESNNELIEYKTFDCVKEKFPSIRDIESLDGWIITGSAKSVNDSETWINDLIDLVRYIFDRKRKLIGICFGHQIIVKALGGKVTKNPKGWQLSTQKYELNNLGRKIFQTKYISLLSIHRDIVYDLSNTKLESIGGNTNCPIFGVYLENRILTIQGHPEYLPINIQVLLSKIEANYPGQINEAKQRLNQDTDRNLVSQILYKFLAN